MTEESSKMRELSRKEKVERARDSWVRSLIDLSRQNMLLYYRDLKKGTLDITKAEPSALEKLLSRGSVLLTELFLDEDELKDALERAKEVRHRAMYNLEEKGLDTLYIAYGMATWEDDSSGRPPAAPVLLLPATFEAKGRNYQNVKLTCSGEIQINPTLIHVLEVEFGCEMDSDSLLDGLTEESLLALLPGPNSPKSELYDASSQDFTIVEKLNEGEKAFVEGETVYDHTGEELSIVRALPDILQVKNPGGLISWVLRDEVWRDQGYSGELEELQTGEEQEIGEVDMSDLQISLASQVFDRLESIAVKVPGFRIEDRLVLGNFSFQKMAMVRDLRDSIDLMVSNDLISGLAGDSAATSAMMQSYEEIDMVEIDKLHPKDEFLILDADSSQQKVIAAALKGQNLVVQGPPGTGKSQTIANLIAVLTAKGKKVLFVAEKRAALEVVLNRLDNVGLRHLVLDLHGASVSRKAIFSQLATSLEHVRNSTPVDLQKTHNRLMELRTRLNNHAQELNWKRSPSNLSIFEMQGYILQIPEGAKTTLRWRNQELDRLTLNVISRVSDLLTEAKGFSSLFMYDDPSPWTKANLREPADAQRALDLTNKLVYEDWPKFEDSLLKLQVATGIPKPVSIRHLKTYLELVRRIVEFLDFYDKSVFNEDLCEHLANIRPASEGEIKSLLSWITNYNFRKSYGYLKSFRIRKGAPFHRIYKEVKEVCDVLEGSRKSFGFELQIPDTKTEYYSLLEVLKELELQLIEISRILEFNLGELELQEIEMLLRSLASDTLTPMHVAGLSSIEQEIRKYGVGRVIDEIRRVKLAPELWINMLEYAWLSSCLDKAYLEVPSLANFKGKIHDSFVEEFKELDKHHINSSSERVVRAHGIRLIEIMNEFPQEAALVRQELKRKRHSTIRKVLRKAPNVLTAVCPCWMASPLSVSQLIPMGELFDVVIFDEASQVLPEDSIPAILRSSQVIVAGDSQQLPPTTFFAAGNDNDGDGANLPTEGFESILDLMGTFIRSHMLEWHYRSKDESLIAFSNRHIYGDSLVTFPGTTTEPRIHHVLVENQWDSDVNQDSSSAEVLKVVDLIIRHATERPEESLGVITMGIKHMRRIEAALDSELEKRPELESFFDYNREERFFVKNLERVQGDERDAIILSIGYGKDRSGKLAYRFGPLLREGGERRLNVAVTRARCRTTLVSSFDHHDMDPGRSTARGVELLRLYLEYAVSNGRIMADTGVSGEPMNPFEMDVYNALTSKGISLLPQYGVSRYRIDLVAQHPHRPGELILAIECDGATYHSAPIARDRDRIRRQHLEALGWSFHRIWSTDWFLNREQEIQRAIDAFRLATVQSDNNLKFRSNTALSRSDLVSKNVEAKEAENVVRMERRSRPYVPKKANISEYTDSELRSLILWVVSDGRLRTDEEIIEEMVSQLGFARKGKRIVDRLSTLLRIMHKTGQLGVS